MFDMLKEILVSKLKVAPEQISLTATMDDIEFDSVAAVELSLLFESELGLEVSDDDLSKVATVADIVELLERSRREADQTA
jgi:acyl carrier protein